MRQLAGLTPGERSLSPERAESGVFGVPEDARRVAGGWRTRHGHPQEALLHGVVPPVRPQARPALEPVQHGALPRADCRRHADLPPEVLQRVPGPHHHLQRRRRLPQRVCSGGSRGPVCGGRSATLAPGRYSAVRAACSVLWPLPVRVSGRDAERVDASSSATAPLVFRDVLTCHKHVEIVDRLAAVQGSCCWDDPTGRYTSVGPPWCAESHHIPGQLDSPRTSGTATKHSCSYRTEL